MATPSPLMVDVATLAAVLGISGRRVQQLVQEGVLPKTQRGQYPLLDAVRAARAQTVDPETATTLKRQKLKLEIRALEIDVAVKERSAVDVDHALAVIARDYAACRARLLELPSKLAALVATLDDLDGCRQVLADAIEEALGELSIDADRLTA